MTLSKRIKINKDLSVVVRHLAPKEALIHQRWIDRLENDNVNDIRDFCNADKFDKIFGEKLKSAEILYLLTLKERLQVLKLSQPERIKDNTQ